MLLLTLGLALFTGTHLLLSLAPEAVASRRASLGENAVKGLIAVFSLAGMILLVIGWRSSDVSWVYLPPPWLRLPGLVLVALSIYLFVLANRPSVVKRVLRHPQLTGLALWCAGHLMLNGENRALLLFAWLGLWAVVEMLLINRREGAWQRADAPPLATDIVTVVISIVALIVLSLAHPWLAGVSIVSLP
ncbi:MAG: NnrU family protein [Halieaceae bacterium]|jgi:uncharacterized membrane protein|nr:NnrU family protein [Halieaceae bacterium]